ncbi:vWA domain-containing protein [Sphingosinicella rhizophila]|uniref:VWA domain-containing protein n=1 Tax=Sphingosinicella rhizophila TaxID=3050082 RepID=A0ABU3QB69_9SPHN|nr:VWA domain-containing protein [Sphingosinicella sp. GR2756]MDT9600641.1 VWA domain-containing protein [Sphingosinicella sp. GR2756]
MSRLTLPIALGVAAIALASCAGTDDDVAATTETQPFEDPRPPQDAALEQEAGNIVVTGSRAERADAGKARPGIDAARGLSPSAPPPAIAYAPETRRMIVRHEPPYLPPRPPEGRDRFTAISENPFRVAAEEPVSTFSIDVDTASYSFVRASLNNAVLPQMAAVRTEEMINYFPYDYAAPRSAAQPFSSHISVFPSPWSPGRKLVRIGIKGYEIQRATRPAANLVFLIDTSGSMNQANKLPLVRQSLSMLLDQLGPRDNVAIVTYAGSAGTALAPTPASQKERIRAVIDSLGAGGSTAGAEGIRQAYALAARNLDPNGINRVILATDGDFNVGITDPAALKSFVERERGKGIFLSVLGFGMGNYNDALMQTLAQNGNGAAAYIDTVAEARKTLVEEASSTLFPIAKDVKIQVEFNPATVAEYRLIGYETRLLNRDDFDNDKVDAGDVGSGQSVTALYEIVPVGGPRAMGDRRYAAPARVAAQPGRASEYGFVKIRYKLPKSDTSRLISTPIDRASEFGRFADAPRDARFAAGVAAFAELLRGGRHSGAMGYDDVLRLVMAARGPDPYGYRTELVQLVRAAQSARSMPGGG